jgi:hypothetical protein
MAMRAATMKVLSPISLAAMDEKDPMSESQGMRSCLPSSLARPDVRRVEAVLAVDFKDLLVSAMLSLIWEAVSFPDCVISWSFSGRSDGFCRLDQHESAHVACCVPQCQQHLVACPC